RLPERAGVNLQGQSLDPALVIKLDGERDPASAGRRAQLRAAILAVEGLGFAERRREPQDIRRIKRLIHSRRQVVPPGPSSKTIPSAFNSSRIRSAVAKSRLALASVRSAIRTSMARLSSSGTI